MTINIGTSGWHYGHWREVFYPPELKPEHYLDYYAREFCTVELNNTFYQLPQSSTVRAWAAQAPDGFIFAVKGSQYITHRKKLKDPERTLPRFTELLPLLGDRLGPVLFQLPPRFKPNLERLAAFLDALPSNVRYAFEFRDKAWFIDPVRDLLTRRGVAFCLYDRGGLVTPEWVTASFVYVRFHGSAPQFGGSYTDEMLDEYLGRIRRWTADGRDVYCYFNNDPFGHAIFNARSLQRKVC